MSSEWNHLHVMNEKSEDRKEEKKQSWNEGTIRKVEGVKQIWNRNRMKFPNSWTYQFVHIQMLINNENSPIQNKWWSQKQWENNDEIKWKGKRPLSWNQNNKRNRSITNIHKERRVCEYQQEHHGMEIEYQLHESKMKLMTEWLVRQTFIISRNDIVIIWNRMTTFNLRTRDGWLFLTTDVFPHSFHDDREDRNWRCSKHTTLTIGVPFVQIKVIYSTTFHFCSKNRNHILLFQCHTWFLELFCIWSSNKEIQKDNFVHLFIYFIFCFTTLYLKSYIFEIWDQIFDHHFLIKFLKGVKASIQQKLHFVILIIGQKSRKLRLIMCYVWQFINNT